MIGIAFFEKKNQKMLEIHLYNASKSEEYKDQGIAWLEYLKPLKG